MAHSMHVAVLVETSTSWGAKVVRGIAEYAHEHRFWSIFIEPWGVNERLRLPKGWHGDGIIARVTSSRLLREIEALHVPCVNISWSEVPGSRLPRVIPDEEAVGRIAADHLLDRGFRRFAYLGLSNQPYYVDRCGPAFAASLAARGMSCKSYQPSSFSGSGRRRSGAFANLGEWLRSLPKPVGLLTWDSVRGRLVADACALAGLRIPEEVGVISGYNDDLMCEIAIPPLSCVDHSPQHIGKEAAALLNRLIQGDAAPSQPVLIPPVRVIARRSTDALVIEDRLVAQALRFIRQHAHESISVDDVLKVVPCSRRTLEQRFASVLGRSPAAEIRRIHIEHAMELLAKTDLSISRVAAASGFNYTEVMGRIFRETVGVTPARYRREFRVPESKES